MVSKIVSVLALSGMAFGAVYNNGTGSAAGTGSGGSGVGSGPYLTMTKNVTSISTGAASSPTSATGNGTPYSNGTILADEKVFCNFYSNTNKGYDLNGVVYKIECGANFGGRVIDASLTVSISKRAVAEPGLPNCINNCNSITADSTATCVATSYNRDTEACTYYSEVYGPIANPGNAVDFALVVDAGSNAAGALPGSAVPLVTSVVPASTQTYTIYSCAATVTDCPYRQVATSVVPAYTTVCPGNAAATGLAAPVACTSCPYYAQVVTVYTATCPGNGASTTYVPVTTAVYNVPTPTGSGYLTTATTVCTACSGSGASATSSGVVAFTGAAHHVEAGMGMAALVGAAALLI